MMDLENTDSRKCRSSSRQWKNVVSASFTLCIAHALNLCRVHSSESFAFRDMVSTDVVEAVNSETKTWI